MVALLMTAPNQVIKADTPGPAKRATRPPATMVTMGVTTMSNGVLPDTRRPISAPTRAARYAPTGPPRS